MMASQFKKDLARANRPVPASQKKRVTRGRQVWWSPVHLAAIAATVVALTVSGFWFHDWLDGRTVVRGIEDILHKTEAEHPTKAIDLGQPVPTYASCAALRQVYPIGVPRAGNPKVYEANRGLDTNRNLWACEDNQPDVVNER